MKLFRRRLKQSPVVKPPKYSRLTVTIPTMGLTGYYTLATAERSHQDGDVVV